jgi:hypothetical protein
LAAQASGPPTVLLVITGRWLAVNATGPAISASSIDTVPLVPVMATGPPTFVRFSTT